MVPVYPAKKRLEFFLFKVSLTLAVWSMAWQECIAALVLDHPVEQILVCLCSFLLADVSVRVVSDSCTFIMHFLSVCCSSSAAPQECPDLIPICLMKWLLISAGQAWPCNQPSSLLPLFHSTSPVWSHFKGTAPTLLGVIWPSFLAWAQNFLGCLKIIWLPSYPKLFTYITVFFYSDFV